MRTIHIYNHIVELFSLCFKKFIEIALKYFGKGDKHINCRVVVAIFYFTENAGCYIDIFKLELGNNLSCFQSTFLAESYYFSGDTSESHFQYNGMHRSPA